MIPCAEAGGSSGAAQSLPGLRRSLSLSATTGMGPFHQNKTKGAKAILGRSGRVLGEPSVFLRLFM